MEATSFEISFTQDFWLRFRANMALYHRRWGTWFAYAFFVGVPTYIFIAALIKGFDISEPAVLSFPVWACLLGGYAYMFVCMPLLIAYRVWSASRRNRTILGIQTQVLTPEGFSTSGDTFNVSVKWDAIHKAVETRHFFFLYISSGVAYYIPKARISPASELERLRTVLKSCLHEKAKLRSSA